jgi:WD40 repeat protein
MRYPSAEFDAAVAAVCHGTATGTQFAALQELLRGDAGALDAYVSEVELHAYLASVGDRRTVANWELHRANITLIPETSTPNADRRGRLAISATLLVITLCWLAANGSRSTAPTTESNRAVAVQVPGPFDPDLNSTNAGNSTQSLPPLAPFGAIRPNIRFDFAAQAPVIVGTGGRQPIRLGGSVPCENAGDTLNVWNWEKSPESRVFKNVPLREDQRFTVSADGRWLVIAQGDVVDLETGNRSQIDLGGAEHYRGIDERLRRIQDLKFSPDGSRLALLVTDVDVTTTLDPLRRHDLQRTQRVQILEFPSGKLLCDFSAGIVRHLEIGFSPDGRRVFKDGQRVLERSSETGEILREYEPQLQGHAYAFDISADGKRLAVNDNLKAIMIWDTTSGQLQHRIKLVGEALPLLRFSPDGRYIAISQIGQVCVIEAATGQIVATLEQWVAGDFHWSADGEVLTVIMDHARGHNVNIYPWIDEWDWRAGKLLRSLGPASQAAGK